MFFHNLVNYVIELNFKTIYTFLYTDDAIVCLSYLSKKTYFINGKPSLYRTKFIYILECGSNEVYSTCSAHCESTCSNIQEMCFPICNSGCVCETGYVREDTTQECIKEEYCLGGFG